MSGIRRGQLIQDPLPRKRVVKKEREASVISSCSSQNITSYRTAPVTKPNSNQATAREAELLEQIKQLKEEVEGYKTKAEEQSRQKSNAEEKPDLFEKFNMDDNFEEPVSFRDNIAEDQEEKVKLECDSDFDYEQFEEKLKAKNGNLMKTNNSQVDKVKLKKLSKVYDKSAIMKLFDHIDSELNCDFQEMQLDRDVVYLQDENQRIWEIRLNNEIDTRNLDSISSLKSLDSPISAKNMRLSTLGEGEEEKRQSTVNSKPSPKNESGLLNEIIDYQSMHSDSEERYQGMSFDRPSPPDNIEVNLFDLY